MASQSDGWNSFISGLNDIAGVAKNVGDAKNAWTQTSTSGATSNVSSYSSSLDNLASSLASSAKENQKLLVIGGLGLCVLIAGVMMFRRWR